MNHRTFSDSHFSKLSLRPKFWIWPDLADLADLAASWLKEGSITYSVTCEQNVGEEISAVTSLEIFRQPCNAVKVSFMDLVNFKQDLDQDRH